MTDLCARARKMSQAQSKGSGGFFCLSALDLKYPVSARCQNIILDGLLLTGPFVLYVGSIVVLQSLSGGPTWDGAIIPDANAPLQVGVFLVALVAVFLLTHFVPGLPWVLCFFWDKERDRTFDLLAKSFLMTLGAYIALITASKVIFAQPVSRIILILLLSGMTLAGALIAYLRGVSAWQAVSMGTRNKAIFGLTFIWITLLVVSVWQPLLFGMYNGDGIEVFYLARSLRSEVLPAITFSATPNSEPLAHWNVTLIPILNAFLRFPSQLLLGGTEFSTRFPVICSLFCLPAILGRFVSAFSLNRDLPASTHLVILSGLFSYCVYAVVVSRNPIIEPPDLSYGYHIHFVSFAYVSLYYLGTGRSLLFGFFAAAASLTRWHEFVYFLVPFAALYAMLFGKSIRPLVGTLVGIGLLYCALLVALWFRGDVEYNYDIMKAEQAGRLGETVGLWLSGHLVLGVPWFEFFFVSGGLMLTIALFRNRMGRIDILFGISFVLFVLVVCMAVPEIGNERLHYLLPVILLPACVTSIYLLRCQQGGIGRVVPYLALALGVCSFFVVQSWRPEPTALREAARKTALMVDDVERFSRSPARRRFHSTLSRSGLMAKGLEYDLLWVRYLDRREAVGPQHSAVITDRRVSPACMNLLDQAGPYFLYANTSSDGC